MEVRDVLMEVSLDPSTGRVRPRGKRRGKQLAAQVERNLNEAVRRLARIFNANFRAGDLFLTLKYSDGRLPATKEEAKRLCRNFMRRIARAYKKAAGKKLRWVMVTADRSSKTGLPVRLHHHIVMDPAAWELIAANWPEDQFSYRRLDGSGDYTAVAVYMIKNAGYQRGERTWSASMGLEKPEFSRPEPVKGDRRVEIPKGARIVERVVRENGETGFYAGYLRYIEPKREEKAVSGRGKARACERAVMGKTGGREGPGREEGGGAKG